MKRCAAWLLAMLILLSFTALAEGGSVTGFDWLAGVFGSMLNQPADEPWPPSPAEGVMFVFSDPDEAHYHAYADCPAAGDASRVTLSVAFARGQTACSLCWSVEGAAQTVQPERTPDPTIGPTAAPTDEAEPEPTDEPAPTPEPTPEPTAEPTAAPAPVIASVADSPDDFTGLWTAVRVLVDGQEVDFSQQTAAWPTLFGSSDLTIDIEGTDVSFFGAAGERYAYADGALSRPFTALPGLPDWMLSRVITLKEPDLISVSAMNMVIECERERQPSPFIGQWRAVRIETRLLSGDPRELWGFDILLDVNEDGTAILDYIEPETLTWTEEGDAASCYRGTVEAAVMTITDEGLLLYATPSGDSLLMQKDAAQ